MSFRAGASRQDITPEVPNVPLMGWGHPAHRARGGVGTRLYARALALQDGGAGSRLVMVCLDTCFVTEPLRAEVLKRTGLRDEELILSATHTHSAPAGFSGYALYLVTSGGFIPEVFEKYASGTAAAIADALARLRPAELRLRAGVFAEELPVAFNRAIRAWNLNPETRKVTRKERHLAVDREMLLLRADGVDGRPIAAWNWFSVHGTSMHKDLDRIHGDNKGVAATEMETRIGGDFVAVFAQGAAGDVSPNFRHYCARRDKGGAVRDDEESCRLNAGLQTERALSLFAEARAEKPLEGGIAGAFEFADLSAVEVAPEFAGGLRGMRTGPAEIGVPLLAGTAEGGGAPRPLVWLGHWSVRAAQAWFWLRGKFPRPGARDPVQGTKVTVIEAGRSRIFFTPNVENLIFPGFLDPILGTFKRWGKAGALRGRPLSPAVLPIQLARVGGLAIAAVPAEFTTVSGWRLRDCVREALAEAEIERVAIQGYANAYSGYVVTPEEYEFQGYEAGCTHFGKWTLPAYLTKFRDLARRWTAGGERSELRPPEPPAEFKRAVGWTLGLGFLAASWAAPSARAGTIAYDLPIVRATEGSEWYLDFGYALRCGQGRKSVSGYVDLGARRIRFDFFEGKPRTLALLGPGKDEPQVARVRITENPNCRLADLAVDVRERRIDDGSDESLAWKHSPYVVVRKMQYGNRITDLPMMMGYSVTRDSHGHRVLKYMLYFSDEDSRKKRSKVDASMATYGRRSDIEWVYEVTLGDRGEVLGDRYQGGIVLGIGHRTKSFGGKVLAGSKHPVLYDIAKHNVFADHPYTRKQAKSLVGYHLAPEEKLEYPFAREALLFKHPWMNRVTDYELLREGKLSMYSHGWLYVRLRGALGAGEFRVRARFDTGVTVTGGYGHGAVDRLGESLWGRETYSALPFKVERMSELGRSARGEVFLSGTTSLRLEEVGFYRLALGEDGLLATEDVTDRFACTGEGIGLRCRF